MRGLPHVLGLWKRKPPPVGSSPVTVVHAENKWRLLRYVGDEPPTYRTPVLLVPSLINRHYVLDLLPDKSFAAWMRARGHDVYCIDWGTPGDEDRYLTFDEIVDGYLGRALRVAARTSGAERCHVLGYCMGGLLAAIHLAAHPERAASFVTLAAPVRFEEGQGLLERWTSASRFDVRALVDAYGNVPWRLMQGAFHLLRPTLPLAKAVHLLDRAWDDESLDGFLALETWGNDNVSIPGAFYRKYIEELYQRDAFARGELALHGVPARMENIACPTLAITFEHDNIVPWAAAKELVDRVGAEDKEWLHLPGGHVGAVVSKSASKRLWPKISEWWARRDGAAGAEAEPVDRVVTELPKRSKKMRGRGASAKSR
jgi:polyhydroxyalkanoate synthase